MSPQSRGRRAKPRRPSRAPEHNPFAIALRAFHPVMLRADLLEVEVFVSGLLGVLHDPMSRTTDPVLALVDHLRRQHTVASVTMLRVVEQLAWTDAQREAAAAAASELTRRGRAVPAWVEQLGQLEWTQGWALTDVFGDQTSVLAGFRRAGSDHAVMGLVDRNHLGGWARDLEVVDDLPGLLGDIRREVAGSGGTVALEPIGPDVARAELERAIAHTDMTLDPELPESYPEHRALVLARCRALPPATLPEPPDLDGDARRAIVDRFLRARSDLGRSESAAYLADVFVDYGCDYDAGQPMRVGPGKLESMLLGFVARKVVLDAEDRAALPDVVRAWAAWCAGQNQLPAAAVADLDVAVEEILAEFDAVDTSALGSPVQAMLAGRDPAADEQELREILDRRMFAMPFFGTRIGDEDHPRLDPADDDDRRLLLIGEHPEYHAALSGPGSPGLVDGVDPELHITVDRIVVTQLWHDDPPETWAAARRLRDAGMERLDVIHRLAAVMTPYLSAALTEGSGPSRTPAAYVRDLRAVRAPRSVRRSVPDVDVQVKVTLHGSRPPIWRRLSIPGRLTLLDVHHVLQTAFGWDDAHLHQFVVDGTRYAPRSVDLGGALPSDRVLLRDVLGGTGATARYEYDFGDGWDHRLVVEQVHPAVAGATPRCLAGRRAGPAEDCGGIGGWQEIVAALADPAHPGREEILELYGRLPDPAHLDLDAVNAALAVR